MRTLQIFNFGNNVDGARGIRIRFDGEYQEYRVELIRTDIDGKSFVNEDETYFTDDREDAQSTAQNFFNNIMEG